MDSYAQTSSRQGICSFKQHGDKNLGFVFLQRKLHENPRRTFCQDYTIRAVWCTDKPHKCVFYWSKKKHTNKNRNKIIVHKEKRRPTQTPSLSLQISALQRSLVNLELNFVIKAWVQWEAGLYLAVNHSFYV